MGVVLICVRNVPDYKPSTLLCIYLQNRTRRIKTIRSTGNKGDVPVCDPIISQPSSRKQSTYWVVKALPDHQRNIQFVSNYEISVVK